MTSLPCWLLAIGFAVPSYASTPLGDCHWHDYNPEARVVTDAPIAPAFDTLNQGENIYMFNSELRVTPDGPYIHDRKAAELILDRTVEALARYGVRPDHIKLVHAPSTDSYAIFVSLIDVPNNDLRRHIAYHAARFNLRPLFSHLEQLSGAARDAFFKLPPEAGALLVQEFTEKQFMVLNRYFQTPQSRVAFDGHSFRKLLGCP